MFMVFVKTFEINENEVINKYQSELNNSLDSLSKKLSNEYTKITGKSSDEYDKQKLGCYVNVSILDESYFQKIKEKHPRIFELIVKSNYKYFIQQYNSVKFGHGGHKKFIEDDRHISIMEWLMDWPEIATCTPLFDSAYIYEAMYGPNEGYKVDYDYYSLRDLRAKPAINKLFGIDGMPHENKFNYKELYGNIPESYCIMVKNGDKYLFNEKFGLFDIDKDIYSKFKEHYENVVIDDPIYAKFLNIAIIESVFISLCCFHGNGVRMRFDGDSKYGNIMQDGNVDNTYAYAFITQNAYGIMNDTVSTYHTDSIPYVKMVKNGDPGDNINNEVLNSKNISSRRTFNLVGGPFIERPWFADESFMIMVNANRRDGFMKNCASRNDFYAANKTEYHKISNGELFIIDRFIILGHARWKTEDEMKYNDKPANDDPNETPIRLPFINRLIDGIFSKYTFIFIVFIVGCILGIIIERYLINDRAIEYIAESVVHVNPEDDINPVVHMNQDDNSELPSGKVSF